MTTHTHTHTRTGTIRTTSFYRHHDFSVCIFARCTSLSLGSASQFELTYECEQNGMDCEFVETCCQSRIERVFDIVLCFDQCICVDETETSSERYS